MSPATGRDKPGPYDSFFPARPRLGPEALRLTGERHLDGIRIWFKWQRCQQSGRLVVDTSVLVAGLLTPFGAPGVIVSLIAAGRLRLCYDARILAEYADVVRRPAFGFEEADAESFLKQVQAQGELVAPVPLSIGLCHEGDQPFLEVAAEAVAEFLVTDNLGHFPEGGWKGIRIVSPREFLDRLDNSTGTTAANLGRH